MLNFDNVNFELLDSFAKSKAITNIIFGIVIFAIIALSIAIYRRVSCNKKDDLFFGIVLANIILVSSLFSISQTISFPFCNVQVEVIPMDYVPKEFLEQNKSCITIDGKIYYNTILYKPIGMTEEKAENEFRIKREISSEFRYDVWFKAYDMYKVDKNVIWFKENLKDKE